MGSGVLNFLTKSVGVAGLGLIAYDAHHAGKIYAPMYEKNHKAEQLSERYLDDMKLDSPSVVKEAAKKRIFNFFVDENISSFFTTIAGYCKGFGSMLVNHVIPFGLAIGTLCLGGIKGKGFGGALSKFCGAGLLAYGSIFLLQEIFGIGKSKSKI